MAVIRQDEAGQSAAPLIPFSEFLRRLEEKSKEAERLKKELAQAESKITELSKKAASSPSGIGQEGGSGDQSMEIAALRAKAGEMDRKGNLLDAFYLYRRIIRMNPGDIGALYQVAGLYYSAGLNAKAAQTLRIILELDPGQATAAKSLAALERAGA